MAALPGPVRSLLVWAHSSGERGDRVVFRSRFMPCDTCGASVDRVDLSPHDCCPQRLADFQMFGMRDEVAQLEAGVRRYLDTASGRFESWVAARQVRGEA